MSASIQSVQTLRPDPWLDELDLRVLPLPERDGMVEHGLAADIAEIAVERRGRGRKSEPLATVDGDRCVQVADDATELDHGTARERADHGGPPSALPGGGGNSALWR